MKKYIILVIFCLSIIYAQTQEVFSPPFSEGFEDETSWELWKKCDIDEDNGTLESFWTRSQLSFYEGVYSAAHQRGDIGKPQEGWLISPPIYLQPNREDAWVYFWIKTYLHSYYGYSGVWISTTGNAPEDFTEEIWVEEYPNNTWRWASAYLGDYLGQVVYIGFKYSGSSAHTWYLDYVEVKEEFQHGANIYEFPYSYGFEEMWRNWFIVDEDLSGGLNNWDLGNDIVNNGDFALRHNKADAYYGRQKCWAIYSNGIELQEGSDYNLNFYIKTDNAEDYDYSGVLVTTQPWENIEYSSITSTLGDIFHEVWTETEPQSGWRQVYADLSDYAGQTVYLAFFYEGEDAHDCYIDDITISQGPLNLNEIKNHGVKVYPNPAEDFIRLDGKSCEGNIQIYNTIGNLVKTIDVDNENKVYIGDLVSGMYVAKWGKEIVRFIKM